MSKQGKSSNYLKMFLKDMLVIVPFFFVSLFLVWDAVPSQTFFWVLFWACVAALMMSLVGWLALQMFKVVLADQIARKREPTR
jgi:hypothetical protein